MIALAVAGLWLVLAGPASGSSAVGYPPTTCPTVSISTENPLPGGTMTVSGKNFAPNAAITLELHSKATVLATDTTSATGSFSTEVTLPEGVVGRHLIVVVGGDTDATGCPVDPFQVLQIQDIAASRSSGGGSGSGGGTAFTGVDILGLLAGAAVLIGAGVLFNRRGHASRV
jgi:hypothetical protein